METGGQQIMPINTLEDLVFALINEIGLGIGPGGVLYDADTGNEIRCNGRRVVASIDPTKPAIPTDIFILFDPVFDGKLMNIILAYYLEKCKAMGIFEPLTFSEEIETVPVYAKEDTIRSKKTRVNVALRNRKYYSKFYYQKGLKFSEIILDLGGFENIDLTKFDSIPEETINSNAIITNNYSDKY